MIKMVVLFVAVTFLTFVLIDFLRQKKQTAELLQEGEAVHSALGEMEPQWVDGFQLKPALSYHPGHLWVHRVGKDLAYVGLDDFGRRLVGRDAKIVTPPSGTHVNQGSGTATVMRDGNRTTLLSPVSGEIVGVNPRLKNEPDLPFRDPYGAGWLFKVRSPRMFAEIPNLLNGSLVARWMQDTADRFRHQLMLASGSVIQDGGEPVEDIALALGDAEWRRLAGEFLAMRQSSWN
ncbi:glycine cleavage system protein H [bacterium]|nr:glycine cleavage system protein H [bacterium]